MLAAQYVRMSTEHQQYSIENQQIVIAEYAATRGLQIVKTYADHARSGLDLAGRPGLKSLLEDVKARREEFEAILVYDVSRWGRFQDTDESAYYEFVCKRAGVRVHYCAELFPNDDSIAAVLLKTLKRTMAGEYIRELSVKTFAGQCRIARDGYKLGAVPGYGLRRLLVDCDGKPKAILHRGQWKSISNERVKYCLGPEEELHVVRSIFSMFIDERMGMWQIARALNAKGVKRDGFACWDNQAVRAILYNPKYAGCIVFNRTSKRMGGKTVRNARAQWIVAHDSFPSIVSPERFRQAQERRCEFTVHKSNEQLLSDLRTAKNKYGRLSEKIIGADPALAAVSTYQRRLGGLKKVYEQLAYSPPRGVRWIDERYKRRRIRDAVERELLERLALSRGQASSEDRLSTPDRHGRLLVQVARCQVKKRGGLRWAFRASGRDSDLWWVVARMTADNREVQDYVLLNWIPAGPCSLAWIDDRFREKGIIATTLDSIVATILSNTTTAAIPADPIEEFLRELGKG